jgi:hypothetical protein
MYECTSERKKNKLRRAAPRKPKAIKAKSLKSPG